VHQSSLAISSVERCTAAPRELQRATPVPPTRSTLEANARLPRGLDVRRCARSCLAQDLTRARRPVSGLDGGTTGRAAAFDHGELRRWLQREQRQLHRLAKL